MRLFKDNEAREWTVEITVATVKRVRDLLDVDLMESVNGKLVEQLANDPVLLVDVLYSICKPQADRDGVSDEQFGEAMAGDAIERGTMAFLEELVDFFPAPRRGLLAKVIEKMKKLEGMAITAAAKKLDSGEIEKQMEEAISGELSGPLPVPQE